MISLALATNDALEVDHVYLFLENCKWRFQENCVQFKIT